MNPIATRAEVDDFYVSTAEELLDMLSPRHALWRDDPTGWIYRGQSNAAWELQPSAYRNTVDAFARVGIRVQMTADAPDWSVRGNLQDKLLTRFGDALDRSGIPIPAPNPELDSRRSRRITTSAEPAQQLYPLMALAQHHRLPTMLLDWSRRALVAAYFAAAEAADESKHASMATSEPLTHVAVWALYRARRHAADGGLIFFEAPASTNPNLRAQDGLFTVLPPSDADDRSVEQYLERMAKVMKHVAPNVDGKVAPLRRIMLPVSETKKLLRLLSYEGVTGASMFPGADGVVRAMREMVLWDQPPT